MAARAADRRRHPDRTTGVGWANMTAPGLDAPLGWDKTSIETRVDPAQEQGKLATTLSRAVPVGDDVLLTLENGVSVTRTLPGPAQPLSQSWASSQALRLNIVPTDTTFRSAPTCRARMTSGCAR